MRQLALGVLLLAPCALALAAPPADFARLRIDFKSTPRMGGTLEHWQYDTFVTHFDDRTSSPPM